MNFFNKNKLTLIIITFISAAGYTAEDSNTIMVTTAAGFKQKIEDAPASISVIERKQLEDKAYRDITDALKDLPGVHIIGGASSTDISIRGMPSKYTMILVDGKRVDTRNTRPNSDGSGIEQGWLPPLVAIERIEVVRGSMSSLHGSDAMGGVINIITRKIGKTWHGSLRADTTIAERSNSGNADQGSLYLAGPLIDGVLGMKANGLYSHRNEDKFVGGYKKQSMGNAGVAFSFTPDEQNNFDLDLKHDKQQRDSMIGKTRACTKPSCKDDNTTYRRNNYALTHNGNYQWGSMDTFIQRDESENSSREMKYNDNLFKNQTVFDLDSHKLSIGAQYRYEDLHDQGNQLPTATNVNKLTRWSWALFTEDEWMITNDFSLTAGIRMDKDENFGAHWTPRLYGVWHINDQWVLKGGVSTGYRSPDLRQVAPNWGQITGGQTSKGIILGNPNLKPEKSVGQEIGLLWNNQDYMNIGVTVFNADFKDKIMEYRLCGGKLAACSNVIIHNGSQYDFISTRDNVDKANLRGIEATFDWQIMDNLSMAANYTYSDSEQLSGNFKGQAFSQIPKHMANASLSWQATTELEAWTGVNFRGRTNQYLSRSSMANKLPSYTFVDLGVNYALSKNLSLFTGVYNVLDRRLVDNDNKALLDGRRYNLGLNYNF